MECFARHNIARTKQIDLDRRHDLPRMSQSIEDHYFSSGTIHVVI